MDDPLKPCRRLKAQTIQACLDELTAHFEAAGIETPGLDARKLLSHATGFTREQLITSSEVSLNEQQANEIEVCLRRRINREPVSRIIGKRAFYGHDFNDPKWFGEGVGIDVRKGDNDLREKLNAAIKQIRADGTYKKINAKYFDFDVYGK